MNSVAPSLRPSACSRSSSSGGELDRDRRAPVRLHRRARPVGRQLQQRRRARQLLLPVRELPLQHLALQPLALPHGVVRVLHRQLRQRRLAARRGTPRRAPPARGRARPDQPSVTMWCIDEQQHVLLARPAAAAPREERARREVERPPRLLAGAPPDRRLALRRAQRRQVLHRQREPADGRDHLHRRAVHLARRWCAAPRGAGRSRPARAPAPPRPARPSRRSAAGML